MFTACFRCCGSLHPVGMYPTVCDASHSAILPTFPPQSLPAARRQQVSLLPIAQMHETYVYFFLFLATSAHHKY